MHKIYNKKYLYIGPYLRPNLRFGQDTQVLCLAQFWGFENEIQGFDFKQVGTIFLGQFYFVIFIFLKREWNTACYRLNPRQNSKPIVKSPNVGPLLVQYLERSRLRPKIRGSSPRPYPSSVQLLFSFKEKIITFIEKQLLPYKILAF